MGIRRGYGSLAVGAKLREPLGTIDIASEQARTDNDQQRLESLHRHWRDSYSISQRYFHCVLYGNSHLDSNSWCDSHSNSNSKCYANCGGLGHAFAVDAEFPESSCWNDKLRAECHAFKHRLDCRHHFVYQ